MAATRPYLETTHVAIRLALAFFAITHCGLSAANEGGTAFRFIPDYLSVNVQGDDSESPRKASFRSGLGMQFGHELLDFSADYKIQTELEEDSDNAVVSQKAGTTLRSSLLDDILGVNTDITAEGMLRAGGSRYAYSVTPRASRSLAGLGRISMQYLYLRDKDGSDSAEQAKQGYRMGFTGAVFENRLTWKGDYRSIDIRTGNEQLRRVERMAFESRYRVMPTLHIRASGFSKDEILPAEHGRDDVKAVTRYGIGLSWSPSPYYSLAVNVNRLDESRDRDDQLFSSSSFTWRPQSNMEFTVSYGDDMIEGNRGIMFNTRVDLDSG